MKRIILAIPLVILLILSIPVHSYAAGYTGHVLSSPADSYSWASDINDSGQIVGTVQHVANCNNSAVLWNSYGSSPQLIGESNSCSSASLINNAGLVIGQHESPPGHQVSFFWSTSAGITNSGSNFFMRALNENGTIVGCSSINNHEVPVVSSTTGSMTYLDNPCGGVGGHAFDVNNSGYIVGESFLSISPRFHASIWYDGDAVDIGAFGVTCSQAIGINNIGQVVGIYGEDEGSVGNFIWSANADTIFIPSFASLDGGSFAPIDISDNGIVLGNAKVNGVDTVITWSMTGGYTIVGTGLASAINSSGWIVGISDLNESKAMVWQPVPEPSAFAVLAGGLVAIISQARRRRSL